MDEILKQSIEEEQIPFIVVIDERPVFRSGLAAAIGSVPLKSYVKEISDIQSLDVPDTAVPDVVLLGVDYLPVTEIRGQVTSLKQGIPSCKIILYDFGNPVETLSDFFGMGVDGFLTRYFDNYELGKCLAAVMTGKKYLSNDILSRFFDANYKQKAGKRLQLSKTEKVVAHHLVVGRNVSWIAQTLDKKLSTISTIKSNIFKKMCVANVIELQKVLSDAY